MEVVIAPRMMAKSEVEPVAVGFGESPPKTASGSVPPHSGQAINGEAQIARFSIANPYRCFGEVT
jgi:hypothetical protein